MSQLELPKAPILASITPSPARRPRQRRLPGVPASPRPLAPRPIIKSVGGKTRLLPILRAHLPPGGLPASSRYLEPFCGGAALFFDLARPGSILGDLNGDLIETYAAVKFDVETVIRHLHEHAWRHAEDSKRHYYFMRELWNDPACEMGTCERAAVFLYLNRTCFNGLWRVSKSGAFNVPIGRYKNPTICPADKLRAAASLLASAKLCAGDFATVTAMACAGDLVLLDPPYDGGSFVQYTSVGGGPELQERIATDARELADRGVSVMATNHDTPLVRELYAPRKGWHVAEVSAPRSVAAAGGKRGPARELLITSYKPVSAEGN